MGTLTFIRDRRNQMPYSRLVREALAMAAVKVMFENSSPKITGNGCIHMAWKTLHPAQRPHSVF